MCVGKYSNEEVTSNDTSLFILVETDPFGVHFVRKRSSKTAISSDTCKSILVINLLPVLCVINGLEKDMVYGDTC